jgi:hypothetical protein
MTTIRYAHLGSISSGTLRTEDLLDTFRGELAALLKRQTRRFARARYRALIRAADRALANSSDDAVDLVVELEDALNDFAPPYTTFGSHPGDGADFGFWLMDDFEDFDGLRVNDLSEVPASWRGEVLLTNDHGNLSLYVAGARGRLREVWSIV